MDERVTRIGRVNSAGVLRAQADPDGEQRGLAIVRDRVIQIGSERSCLFEAAQRVAAQRFMLRNRAWVGNIGSSQGVGQNSDA